MAQKLGVYLPISQETLDDIPIIRRSCFVHTFVRLACELCARDLMFQNLLWGRVTMLITQFGMILLDA